MSKFDQVQSEAKNIFLTFIINNDFLAGNYVYNGAYTKAILQMHFIVTKISKMVQIKEVQDLEKQLTYWIENIKTPSEKDIRESYKKLSDILSDKFYSEFHLGIIPTSTLKTETETPAHTAVSPTQSSRL